MIKNNRIIIKIVQKITFISKNYKKNLKAKKIVKKKKVKKNNKIYRIIIKIYRRKKELLNNKNKNNTNKKFKNTTKGYMNWINNMYLDKLNIEFIESINHYYRLLTIDIYHFI